MGTVREWLTPQSAKIRRTVLVFRKLPTEFHSSLFRNCCTSVVRRDLKSVICVWRGREQQQSFDALIERLTSPPVPAIPTTNGQFVFDTEASDLAIDGELNQIQD